MNPKRYKMAKQQKPKKPTKPSKPITTLDDETGGGLHPKPPKIEEED